MEVDDLFTFGNEAHEGRMAQLRERFRFGKYEVVMHSSEGVGFNGRRVKQLPNYDFEVDMTKFVCERLEPVALGKGRTSDVKELANDSEIAQMTAVIGGLNWTAKEGRPDCAAAASLGAASFLKPRIQHILKVNRAVKVLKDRSELSIKIRAVDVDKLAWGVISDTLNPQTQDLQPRNPKPYAPSYPEIRGLGHQAGTRGVTHASFANAYGGHSQGAYGILAFHEDLQKGCQKWKDSEDRELYIGG